jgi:hypothetical protein
VDGAVEQPGDRQADGDVEYVGPDTGAHRHVTLSLSSRQEQRRHFDKFMFNVVFFLGEDFSSTVAKVLYVYMSLLILGEGKGLCHQFRLNELKVVLLYRSW